MFDNGSGGGRGDGATGPFDEPIDLSAVMRDEQLINALLAGDDVQTATTDEFEIASLFSAARHHVLDAPIEFEFTEEQIAAALAPHPDAGRPRFGHSRTRRLVTTLVAGAASVAMVLGGLTIVAGQMGDSPAATDGQTQQIVSASMIRADLDEAANLLDSGDVARGVELIAATTSKMGRLDRTAEFEELDKIRVHLWSRATGQPEASAPVAGSQPTVPKNLPVIPVPVIPPAPPVGGLPVVPLPVIPGLPTELPALPLLPAPPPQEVTEEPAPPTTTAPPPPTTTTAPPTTTTSAPPTTPAKTTPPKTPAATTTTPVAPHSGE